jgi:hypothetical protein
MGFSIMTFIYVALVILGLLLAAMILLAPIKLWSIDSTLKAILEELKKSSRS